jgi:hypothetical protein
VPTLVESRDDSFTLDSTGSKTLTFDADFDQCQMTVQSPQSGAGAGIVGGTCEVTGARTVKVRLFRTESSPDSGSVLAASNEQVVCSFLTTKN